MGTVVGLLRGGKGGLGAQIRTPSGHIVVVVVSSEGGKVAKVPRCYRSSGE